MRHMRDNPSQDHSLAWGTRGTAGATFAGNIAFEDVSYSVGHLQILRDINFSLSPGEVVCLLGPSGCGKTSLLRLAAGVSRPTSGRILIDGVEVSGPTSFAPPERRNVGLMFQDFALFPHMTVIDNVAYGLYALQRAEALAIAERALERVGLAKYRNSYPHVLSGGEQQRVALARAIVPRPQVMLMDEPFSGLDQRLRETVRTETLALLRETRATCIFVTHDPLEAMEISDRILFMRNGTLAQVGSPQQLFNHPVDAAAARFFCDLNEVSGRVSKGFVDTPLGRFAAPGFNDGAQVAVMIRPQAIRRGKGREGVEGFVSERRFLGDVARLTVNVAGLDAPLYAIVDGSESISKGQSARFVTENDGILIFTNA
jgi:iron(III) transport system ATP-binding protein